MSMTIASCLSSQKEHGQIQIIFGPMFSGKTTELMRRMKRYQIANHRCLIIKYAQDNRYDENGIATHDRQVLPAVGAEVLSELTSQALQYDIIGIDEGQFFPDIVTFSDKMAEQGKIVIVAALDGDFQKKGFGKILDLVPLAESVVKLSAVCMMCFKEASFTKRIHSDTEKAVIQIGGADKYMSACRQCYFSPVKQDPSTNSSSSSTSCVRSPLKGIDVNNAIDSGSGHLNTLKPKRGTPVKSVSSSSSPLKSSRNALVDVENAVKRLF